MDIAKDDSLFVMTYNGYDQDCDTYPYLLTCI